MVHVVLEALTAPLGFLVHPERRVHYAFLASAVILAIWVAWSGRRSWRSLPAYLLPWRLWTSRSSRLDVQLLAGNAVVRALVLAPVTVSSMTVVLAVAGTMTDWFGAPQPSALPHWLLVSGYTVALFVFDDLSRYLVHRTMHRSPMLWAIHKIHHTAEVLTPLTLYRVHPLESLIMGVRYAVTIGVLSALWYYAFPGRLTQWEIMGVNAINIVFTAFGSNLRHSHVWLSFGPRLERWLMSPAQHQVHHSTEARHFDKNFGVYLAVWDRLARTLQTTSREPGQTTARLRFGLGADKSHKDGLLSAYAAPFVDIARHQWARMTSRPDRLHRLGRIGSASRPNRLRL